MSLNSWEIRKLYWRELLHPESKNCSKSRTILKRINSKRCAKISKNLILRILSISRRSLSSFSFGVMAGKKSINMINDAMVWWKLVNEKIYDILFLKNIKQLTMMMVCHIFWCSYPKFGELEVKFLKNHSKTKAKKDTKTIFVAIAWKCFIVSPHQTALFCNIFP